jgi:hypothetical protein
MSTKRHRWLVLMAVLTAGVALVCCGDDDDVAAAADGGTPPTLDGAKASDGAQPDVLVPDGGRLSSCVERPNAIPRPPTGRLPCELIPPGLTL